MSKLIKLIQSALAIERGEKPTVRTCKTYEGVTEISSGDKVEKLIIPSKRDYRGRTIRLHEMLHAQHSKHIHLTKAIADQAIEDCFVHLKFWPKSLPEISDDEAVDVALEDCRNLLGNRRFRVGDYDGYNIDVMQALRALCITTKCGTKAQIRESKRLIRRAFKGKQMVKTFDSIIDAVRRNNRTKARRLFQELITEPEAQMSGVPVGGRSNKMPAKGNLEGIAQEDADESDEDNPQDDGFKLDEKLSKFLSIGPKSYLTSHGGPPMAVIELPRVEHCDAIDTFVGGTAPASNGQRLVVGRFAHTMASGQTFGLFRHRSKIKKYNGTCLIDASGSMGMDENVLKRLCRDASFMQVAYYSDHIYDRKHGEFGTLVVYAKDGKRATEIQYRSGGNAVDLFALRWLLLQQAPLYLVSDEHFCEGPDGQDDEAHVLLNANRSKITVIPSCALAMKLFKEKKENQQQ